MGDGAHRLVKDGMFIFLSGSHAEASQFAGRIRGMTKAKVSIAEIEGPEGVSLQKMQSDMTIASFIGCSQN